METRRSAVVGLAAALIVALGLILGGFLAGGRYEMTIRGAAVVRLDKWTGEAVACGGEQCAVLMTAGDNPRGIAAVAPAAE